MRNKSNCAMILLLNDSNVPCELCKPLICWKSCVLLVSQRLNCETLVVTIWFCLNLSMNRTKNSTFCKVVISIFNVAFVFKMLINSNRIFIFNNIFDFFLSSLPFFKKINKKNKIDSNE